MWIIKDEKYIIDINVLMYLRQNDLYGKIVGIHKTYLGYAFIPDEDFIEIRDDFIYSNCVVDYFITYNRKVYFICG